MKTGTTNFRALFGQGQRVEIPVIQRDYAQGRADERSQEIRARFVKELARALSDDQPKTTPLDLDFVYGRWNDAERTLEPLDGQQRLTTLFLLHWYVACLDNELNEFRSWITHRDGGSCFTYRTRPAARDFFDALILQPAPVNSLAAVERTVSDWVADSVWFVRSWRRDPTVRGCLTMLDAFHDCLSGSKGLWPRLVSTSSPAIVFRLLLLENFGLSDDLYVKMNARGKALTPFEVFKAELEQFVAESFSDQPCPAEPEISWRSYISRQFDTSWTDFLWKHRGELTEIDSHFMHLIRAVVLVGCVNQGDDLSLARRIEGLLVTPQPSLLVYQELGCLDPAIVKTLVGVLDALAGHNMAPMFVGYTGYLDEELMFRRILLARGANQEDGLTLIDWVMFYAWCSFVLRFSSDLGTASVRAAFHDWTRVVSNLARNSSIDRNDRLLAALRGLRQLVINSGTDILSLIANGALDGVGGFNQQQQREEQIKAQLIVRSSEWRPLIERAETHPYFRGDIEFLLRFSGVFDRHARSGRCDWENDEDDGLRNSFAKWYDRACAVFREDATSWPRTFPEFLWERALLAEGDYLLRRGRNWSFLDDKDRDASWKRLLRADTQVPDREARRDVIRRVLAQIEPTDVSASLQSIVAAGVRGSDNAPLPGFRKRLVTEPRLIEYCDNRMVRFEDGTAFLLRRSQRNGYHVDLYVYDLYFRLRERMVDFAPFEDLHCADTTGVDPPSRLILSVPSLGLSVTVEKHSDKMRLQLQLTKFIPQLTSMLSTWTADDDTSFSSNVVPDEVETKIIDLALLLRSIQI